MLRIITLILIITTTFASYKIFAEVTDSTTIQKDSLIRISPSDFMYADSKRYSMNGELPLKETHIDPLYLSVLGASSVAFMWFQYDYQKRTIWEEQAEFRIIEDGQYALNADKAGHIIGTYYTAYLYTELYSKAGINWELSNILGASTGLLYTTYVEVMDGYGKNFGFSPSDFYADVAGAGFFILQYYVPYMQNFTPKFMYIPADWHGEHKRRPHFAFIDDYSSHTLWLSANVHNMLPDTWSEYWPKWLQLSFGYAARNLCDPFDPQFNCTDIPMANGLVRGERRYIIALDYNLVELLPEMGQPIDWMVQTLNYFKLPSPAIEFGRETKFSLVYPFLTF